MDSNLVIPDLAELMSRKRLDEGVHVQAEESEIPKGKRISAFFSRWRDDKFVDSAGDA